MTDDISPKDAELMDRVQLRPDSTLADPPLVSVVIPHYADLENLKLCLKLLDTQSLPRNTYEIVVADNNSPCGLAAVEEACAGIARVIPAPLQGAGEARNAGVQASLGRYLAFIDSDCRPFPHWLERGVEALEHADMVGGSVEVTAADPQNPTAVEAFEMVFAFNSKRYIEKVGFSVTANLFVSRATFDKVGGFRSQVAEDVDWGRRAVSMGYRWCYEPSARLAHPARHNWDELERKWTRLIHEGYQTMREQRWGSLKWVLRSWLILLSPVFHVPAIFRSQRLQNLKTRMQAAGILFKLRWWRFVQSYAVMLARR
jgi:glycosyltransferase involved in cell wall biosynthesis